MAARRSHVVAAEIDVCFESARSLPIGGLEEGSLSVASARSIILTEKATGNPQEVDPPAPAAKLGEIYPLYLADPRHSRGHRTTEAYLTTQRWVEEFFRADTPVTSISRERCRDFVAFLLNVPKFADKRFPGLTLAQAVEATRDDSGVERINAAHINGYLNKFAGALNWAEQEGIIARNRQGPADTRSRAQA